MAIGAAPQSNIIGPDKFREGNEKFSLRVLVADDSEINRESLKENLEARGYTVVVVEDGQLLMDKLREENFNLIITDRDMPNKTGLEVIEEISSSEEFKKIPVILMTGFPSAMEKNKLESLGVPYLPKPFLIKKLYDLIDELIQKSESLK
ncbi:MAG: response regulator [bacterium]